MEYLFVKLHVLVKRKYWKMRVVGVGFKKHINILMHAIPKAFLSCTYVISYQNSVVFSMYLSSHFHLIFQPQTISV